MIECTDEFIYYSNSKLKRLKRCKKRSRVRRFFTFIVLLSVIIGLYIHINGAVYGLITDICADYAEARAVSSVNSAVALSLSDGEQYSDFITVEHNNSGDITFMSVNSQKVNSLSRSVTIAVEALLKSELEKGVPIPIMAFMGLKFASGFGREIRYSAITVSSVNCRFDGKFTSVGINQTLHSLYVTVVCKVNVEFLYKKAQTETVSEILICESVLVGKVPEIYLNGALFR